MVHLQPIAEVLDAGSFAVLPAEQRPKGQSVEEVLLRADADDCVEVPVPTSMREQLRTLAAAMGDAAIGRDAEVASHRVPVGHLRQLPPDTRVLIGIRVKYTEAESQHLKD